MKRRWPPLVVTAAALAAALCVAAAPADRKPRGGGDGGGGRGRKPSSKAGNVFRTEVPAHPVDVIPGRPTQTSVILRVLSYADAEACVAYGAASGRTDRATAAQPLRAGEPADLPLGGLRPDTEYAYRLRLRAPGAAEFRDEPEARFHTARAPGSAFVFTITADPHLDDRTDPEIYRRTLLNAAADRPDFHVDLGDTFMTEKHPTRETAAKQYLAQRYYFGLVGRSAPLFLALGNHDGEGTREFEGGGDSLGAWSTRMRTRYFPNPVADGFYTGNTRPDPSAGPPQDYYAWTWGDALLVVLDPFRWGQQPREVDDNWMRTLGEEQYRWLGRTLEASRARHKLVFIHHLVGGTTREGRGGAEAAPYFEWGGRSLAGADEFAARRPGWPMPIRDLLRKHGVSVVFHGHDHFFARQESDGIVYQLVPQPGSPGGPSVPRFATEGVYRDGDLLGGSGYLRVSVSAEALRVEYVRTTATGVETAFAYRVPSGNAP